MFICSNVQNARIIHTGFGSIICISINLKWSNSSRTKQFPTKMIFLTPFSKATYLNADHQISCYMRRKQHNGRVQEHSTLRMEIRGILHTLYDKLYVLSILLLEAGFTLYLLWNSDIHIYWKYPQQLLVSWHQNFSTLWHIIVECLVSPGVWKIV